MNADVFAALGDPTRRGIYEALGATGPQTATDLAGALPVSRQAVSKHLTILEDAGLVQRQRAGNRVEYQVRPDGLEETARWLDQARARWTTRLARLAE